MFNTIIKTILAIFIAAFLITTPIFFVNGMPATSWSEFLMAMIMVFAVCVIDKDD